MTTDKPQALAPILDNIPAELRAISRWICWKHYFHKKRQRWIKLPMDPKNPRAVAKVDDPATWSDFETAATAYELLGGVDGLGFVFTDDGLVGGDFDKCLDPATGELNDIAREALGTISGYWELSPSGRGLHFITYALLDKAHKDDKRGIELYKGGRYFTITGRVFGDQGALPSFPQDLAPFVAKHFTTKKENANGRSINDNSGKSPVAAEQDGRGDFFKTVNAHAMQNLSAWVPALFPQADTYQDGYRVTSEALGRDLEESISIVSKGIVDFGVADQGDPREGKRTPIDLVIEWLHADDPLMKPDVREAAMWLCATMGVKPEALGWESRDVAVPDDLPFVFTENGEKIAATISNVTLAIRSPQFCGMRLGFDAFRDEIMLAPAGTDDWRPFTDPDYVKLRLWLEQNGFAAIGRELIRDVVCMVADEYRFDSAILWLDSLPWDGTPRIERFLTDYFNAADSDYVRAVSLYLWTALAGRVLEPGCKADMVPILVGPQGLKKSSAIEAMVPSRDHFVEINLSAEEETLARKMRGRLIGEIAELRGLHSRDSESIKAFISRTHEDWIPKYREFATKFPRRLVMVGTSNPEEFLSDETGNRRWLPVRVGDVDIDAIKTDRPQLWAEARDRFTVEGVAFLVAERLAPLAHAEHAISDVWEDAFARWLDDQDLDDAGPRRLRPVLLSELMAGALRMDIKHVSRKDEMRAGRVLRKLGFAKRTMRIGKNLQKAWVAMAENEAA